METIIFTTVACLLSSGLMGVIAYFIIKRFVENEQKKSLLELKKMQAMENLRVVNPIRLQAYERLALFSGSVTVAFGVENTTQLPSASSFRYRTSEAACRKFRSPIAPLPAVLPAI